jgi:hypothetical protein
MVFRSRALNPARFREIAVADFTNGVKWSEIGEVYGAVPRKSRNGKRLSLQTRSQR